jgi:predicted MFS family arabinose efflux permease
LGNYFDKKRAFALGISVCGTGIGTFVIAPLTKYLVDQYSWQGAILIESAILLNCAVSGALYRPLPITKHKTEEEVKMKNRNSIPFPRWKTK